MSAAPPNLTALMAYLSTQGVENLGIVGNQVHCKGYHLGKDRIYGPCACKPTGTCKPGLGASDYSVKSARDQAGLSGYASAADLGKVNGSYAGLHTLTRWLSDQVMAQAPDAKDIRDVLGTFDGTTVTCTFSGDAGGGTPRRITGNGCADDSHLAHTHISFFRDSRSRDQTALFRRYFGGDDMLAVVTKTPLAAPNPRTFTIPPNGKVEIWDPAQPGVVKVYTAGPNGSSAHADATTSVDYPGTANPPKPRGPGYLSVVDGVAAGKLVPEAQVTLAPADPSSGDVTHTVKAVVMVDGQALTSTPEVTV